MKLTVTRSPADKDYNLRYINVVSDCKAVVNVADTPELSFELADSGKPSFWFPINEIWHWGYSPFYGTAKVVDRYQDVLIHCHAGVNRSKCVAWAILKAEGMSDVEAAQSIKDDVSRLFAMNLRKGYIPVDIIEFLRARHIYKTYSMMGLLAAIKSPNLILNKKADNLIQKIIDINIKKSII